MKITPIVLALSLSLLAACHRSEPQPKTASPASSGSTAAPQPAPSKPVTSSVNSGKSEPTPPVQGREDTRQPEQRRDFQHPDTGGK